MTVFLGHCCLVWAYKRHLQGSEIPSTTLKNNVWSAKRIRNNYWFENWNFKLSPDALLLIEATGTNYWENVFENTVSYQHSEDWQKWRTFCRQQGVLIQNSLMCVHKGQIDNLSPLFQPMITQIHDTMWRHQETMVKVAFTSSPREYTTCWWADELYKWQATWFDLIELEILPAMCAHLRIQRLCRKSRITVALTSVAQKCWYDKLGFVNVNMPFYWYKNSLHQISRPWDCLIFVTGIQYQEKWSLF